MSETDPVLPVTRLARRVLVLLLTSLLLTAASPVGSQAVSGHPAVVEKRVIGHTVRGQDIVAWRLGQPTSPRKVVILSAMHGDETGPSRILYNLRDGRTIRGADVWVVPRYNGDGIRRHTRQNARGVDLNRNFPRHWKHQAGATSSGPRPASEPETRAVMRFLRRIHPDFVVSFHQPLHGVGRTDGKGGYFVQRLHRGLRLPVKSFNCSGVCHGTMTEWFNATQSGIAVTVEYGRGLSNRQATRTGPTGLLQAVGARR